MEINRDGKETAYYNGIDLDCVSVKWPGNEKNVLNNISIGVEPGKLVAIVGQVGSGKVGLIQYFSM